MPNGFQGSLEEWRRMEAPYIRIDPILEEFAKQHHWESLKNYHNANRFLQSNEGFNRSIWIASMDKYGESGTYQVAINAYQDREAQRYVKHGIVVNGVGIEDLAQALEHARSILASWSENELHLASEDGEKSEFL